MPDDRWRPKMVNLGLLIAGIVVLLLLAFLVIWVAFGLPGGQP